ncbi:hypothetical protein BJX63DRAFT_59646 [Aspergillus granulosus]|uniref:AB hydrolase-1 domain-containing protein n=1 Tax=Aspergillus granulosus TaxID=176169 RepID=A0ABR4HT52_9EURO
MTDDAAAIQAVTSKLADAGHRIVLVMHSYGGIPGTQSAKDLSWETRQQTWKPGGIVALVYLAAYLVKEGMGVQNQSWRDDIPNFLTIKTGLYSTTHLRRLRISTASVYTAG